jgi:hypothetical protein
MKPSRAFLLVLLFALLVACHPTASPTKRGLTPPATEQGPQATAADSLTLSWDDRSPFRSGLISGQQGILNQLSGASVYHIDVWLKESLLELTCHQEVLYVNQEQDPLEEVWFRLFPNILGGALSVSSVEVDGEAVIPSFDPPRSAMKVPLLTALHPGDQAVIGMRFTLTVPAQGEGNYGMFGFDDKVLALAHFFPIIPAYDEGGWHVEIPPRHGDLLYADTAFFIVSVRAPSSLVLVASGVEVGRTASGDQQHVIYAAGPMRDFYLVASELYDRISQQVGEYTVNSYAPPESTDGARAALAHAIEALKVFGERFGQYPFTEFDIVSTPTSAYGIEYPGVIALAVRLYGPNSEYPPVYLESTVAHEVSHQWFYSAVGNDQQTEPWLDEALAQYCTLAYYDDLYGPAATDGFRSSLYERWQRVDAAPIPIGLPVGDYTSNEYGAIVYGRGPLFVEALASAMGEDTFQRFLRDYYQTHVWGVATAESFQRLAEEHCGCDLELLFQQWVESQ